MKAGIQDITSRGIIYFVAITIGLAFSSLLVSISWNGSIETEENSFQYDSRVLQQLIEQNFTNANDVVEDIAVYIETQTNLSNEAFVLFTDSFLKRHGFIESVNYISYDQSRLPATLKVQFQNKRNDKGVSGGEHFFLSESFRNAIEFSYQESEVSSSAPIAKNNSQNNLWLLKTVIKKNNQNRLRLPQSLFSGVVAISLKPEIMLENLYSKNDLNILIFKDTENQIGRQLIFSKKSIEMDSFNMRELVSQNRVQLPLYTINTEIIQNVYWEEIQKKSIYISALIGFGVTLLLIALIRSREQRNRELANRNIVIETQVEQQTKELAVARDQALEAAKIKADFLASMSHEIRTPLNAITGMADLLAETELNEEQNKYVNVFRKAGDTLLSLVNDILDLSKLEAQQLQLEKIPFDLYELIEETSDIYALKAAEKNIDLICNIDLSLKQYRIGDPSRIRQILLNLISNAIKFTEQGNITVHVTRDENVSEKISFCVSDTGIGIKENKLDSIFASFTQADSSTTRKYGGTGLGLTISKSLVEMMQGNIWVESIYGEGSDFHFTISLPVQEKSKKMDTIIQSFPALIIEENNLSTDVLCNILLNFNVKVSVLSQIDDLLKSDKTKNIVFIESKLFFDNKDNLLKFIDKGSIVLLIRPNMFSQHLDMMKQDGISAFLLKPIKINEVYNQLRIKSGLGSSKDKVKDKEATLNSSHRYKVLLVEDNPDNRLLIKAYLKKKPYDIVEAENGEIALDEFKKMDFDLVLMDVQMPIMDGHTATRLIREYENSKQRKQTPIVSLTAHAIKEEIDKCFEAGCNMHLSKPVKKALLNEMIENLLTNQA